ncbi:MAP3K epsilon protein kinase 1 [Senna tora]|uniref:MAP3K epsilon protein kinase 1 n=1 Tax=Senna tora TaxID=362788 RepID=A0A834W4G6_9FABA|nr:MAP3K epsilon protein kinase 1 [Senna tora]
MVMSFAVPDRPREIRMEAAFFFAAALFVKLFDFANVYSLSWDSCVSWISGG